MAEQAAGIEVQLPLNAVLIGGGLPAGANSPWRDREPLLDAGLEMTTAEVPNVLLVTSARWKSPKTVNALVAGYSNYYHQRGVKADTLHPYLLHENQSFEDPSLEKTPLDPARIPSQAEMADKVAAADLVFVMGGDANRMLNQIWRPLGIDTMLRQAAERGAVISGVSAGCLAWFEGGHTDGSSLHHDETQASYDTFRHLAALGWIASAVCCPHFDQAPDGRPREASFEHMMADRQAYGEIGIGVDNHVALQIVNGTEASVLHGDQAGRKTLQTLSYADGVQSRQIIDPSDGTFDLTSLR